MQLLPEWVFERFSDGREMAMRIVISLITALLPAFASGEVRAQLSLPDAPTALHAQEATRAFVQPLDLMNPKLAIGEPQQIDCPTTRPSVRGNDVELTLTMKYSEHLIRNPDSGFIRSPGTGPTDRVYLRTYYDCPVGPTLTVSPGNRLKLLLKNDLPTNDPSRCPLAMNTPDCFNTGNLHTHGLHVSPAGNGDNVFVRVEPGQSFPYEYNIPSDHPAGTFWYHSHRHGSTALSVSSGMEGVLIVKGERRYEDREKNRGMVDIDTILHDENGQDFKERVLLFQQISYGCFLDSAFQNLRTDSGDPNGKWKCEKDDIGIVENYTVQFGPGSWVNSGRYTGINGKVQPLWQARVGEIERWRLVHGGVRDTINLRIVRATELAGRFADARHWHVVSPYSVYQFRRNECSPASDERC